MLCVHFKQIFILQIFFIELFKGWDKNVLKSFDFKIKGQIFWNYLHEKLI